MENSGGNSNELAGLLCSTGGSTFCKATLGKALCGMAGFEMGAVFCNATLGKALDFMVGFSMGAVFCRETAGSNLAWLSDFLEFRIRLATAAPVAFFRFVEAEA